MGHFSLTMSAACQQHRVARIDIVLEHFAPTVVLAQAQKVCRGLFNENVTKSVIKHSFLFKILDILEFTRKSMVHLFRSCPLSQPNHSFHRLSLGTQAQVQILRCTSSWIIQPVQPREAVAISMRSLSQTTVKIFQRKAAKKNSGNPWLSL